MSKFKDAIFKGQDPSDEAAAIMVLKGPMASMIKPGLRAEARRKIPKIMKREILKNKERNWSPQTVVNQVYEDTSPTTIQVYKLLGIDRSELTKLARQALNECGYYFTDDQADYIQGYREYAAWYIKIMRFIKSIFITEGGEDAEKE